jgi:hypothetical protein
MLKPLVLLTVPLVAGLLLSAQPPSRGRVVLCGLSLELGMNQAAVLREAGRYCDAKVMVPRQIDSQVEIWDLFTKGRAPIRVGGVDFDGGQKVMSLHRDWANEADSEQLVQALYLAAKEFIAEGRTACTLQADQSEDTMLSTKRVTIQCGAKSIVILGAHGPKGMHSEDVTENLW